MTSIPQPDIGRFEKEIIMTPAAIIHGTPVWVWVLLAVLLSRGFKAMSSHTATLSRLAIVPVVFAGWGILHLLNSPIDGWSAAIAWVVAAAVGIGGGAWLASRSRFIVDPVNRTVMQPGSVVPLALMIVAFASKFWLGFELATATYASPLVLYVLLDAAVSGAVAGVFAGRFLTYWKAMNVRRVMSAC
jgi:hypothetical protein